MTLRLPVFFLFVLTIAGACPVHAQQMPSVEENIPFLVTFSKEADKHWGDDDNVQSVFFSVPEGRKDPIYIRVFDPDLGGKNDEMHGVYNSKTKFSIYGGRGAHSDPDARKMNPVGNYKSGALLVTRTFGNDTAYDNRWYTFGPFNPLEGELQPEYGGYIFKLIIEGLKGDDANLYKLFLSSTKDRNTSVEGGNAYAYEYCFRTNDAVGSVSHIYPFVGKNVISIKLNMFDYDEEGLVRIISVTRRGDFAEVSKDGDWSETLFKTAAEEANTSLDIQLIKKKPLKSNNMVIYVTDQYGESLPFYAVPIGGVPKFAYKIGVKPKIR
jgi:hypothetical protein